MSEVEAVGEVVTGALAAQAVEPAAGSTGRDGHTGEAACLNCGTALIGEHCHSCGQRAHVHRTLGAFFHDLVHGVLHFEGKIWNTLPLLAWRPGELTRHYIEGQRARFVSPIALFLFAVFLMFAIASLASAGPGFDSEQVKTEMAREVRITEVEIARLARERALAASEGRSTAVLDRKLEAARGELRLERDIAERGLARGAVVRVSDDVPRWLGKPLEAAAQNPELLLYKVRTNAYKYSWALIPISLPFMWLLFPFSRRFKLYDHTVFVTYSLGFMTLLFIIALLLGAIGLGAVAGLMMLIPPVHMYRQLKGTYALSRTGALWRTAVLISFAVTAAGLFALLLFASGLF